MNRRSARTAKRPAGPAGWPLTAAMVALSAVPLTAGTLRLVQLAGGPEAMPADDRFTGFPAALVVHILGAACYALLGVLQLLPRFRRRHPAWHRRAGRVVATAGLLVAGSALWLTLAYPPQPRAGDLLYVLRLCFGSAMVACLALGFIAIRRRDVAAHRAWMVRAYAIGLAAGTQVFTEGIGGALLGSGALAGDLAKGAGWAINLAVAEWALRRAGGRQRTGRPRSPAPAVRPRRTPPRPVGARS
jgi:uncharacterized membrane protein